MRIASLLLLLFCSSVVAQEPAKQESWLPQNGAVTSIDFNQVTIAKVDKTGNEILLARPDYQTETRTRMVTVTRFVDETRTRLVVGKDGQKDKEEPYTVKVPVQTQVEQSYVVLVPNGARKSSVKLEQVRAWGIGGNPIAIDVLKKRLEKATHVIASEMDLSMEYQSLDPYYRSVMSKNAIVLYIPPGTWMGPLSTATGATAPVPIPTPEGSK